MKIAHISEVVCIQVYAGYNKRNYSAIFNFDSMVCSHTSCGILSTVHVTEVKNRAKSFPNPGHEQQNRAYPIGWLITNFASAYYCIKNSTLKQTHFIKSLLEAQTKPCSNKIPENLNVNIFYTFL